MDNTFLLTEVQDKMLKCIQLLQKDGLLEQELTIREIYDKHFHPNVLPLDKEECWDALEKGSIISIFQFESEVGKAAAAKIKPRNISELSDANGLMRLMTSEKGAETPLDKYVRYKNNISLWYQEMDAWELTKEEQKTIEPYFLQSYGVPPSQEQLMLMLMDKDICDFSLVEANEARSIVGKKKMNKIPELREKVLTKAKSKNLGAYIWQFGVSPSVGYSFSISTRGCAYTPNLLITGVKPRIYN